LSKEKDLMDATMPEPEAPPKEPEHTLLTVAQFAARVHLKPRAIYKRIRLGQMPLGTVVEVLGHYHIDWTVFKASIKKVN